MRYRQRFSNLDGLFIETVSNPINEHPASALTLALAP